MKIFGLLRKYPFVGSRQKGGSTDTFKHLNGDKFPFGHLGNFPHRFGDGPSEKLVIFRHKNGECRRGP